MTFYYRTTTTSSGNQQVSEETKAFWEHASEKKNWRIVQLPNGYYQTDAEWEGSWKDVTRRETIEGAESAIDKSIEHYKTRLEFAQGPKVIKTFE
jgi:hypothetical protein